MTLQEKWSSLFHHVLNNPEKVSPRIAEEAYLLIGWMRTQWEYVQRAEGYCPRAALVQQATTVCEALQGRSRSGFSSESWPSEIFEEWEYERPFHAVLEPYLQSNWESLYHLLRKTQDDGVSGSGAKARNADPILYVVAGTSIVGSAWRRVLKVILPNNWTIRCVPAIDGAYPPDATRTTRVIFGSARDAEAQRAARAHWESMQRNATLRVDSKVIDGNSVMEVAVRLCNLKNPAVIRGEKGTPRANVSTREHH